MYEEIFLPLIRRMVVAFRQAGARHVGFHSDGDIRPLLDGLVDAGIAILHPLEPRAGMDVVALRSRYGRRVAFVGGLCNSHILTFGTDHEVRRHVAHVLSIVENGGLGVGSHTISNDISPDRYSFLMKLLHEYAGRPLPGPFRDC
jgi:uroporphyrinogen decarboxylase